MHNALLPLNTHSILQSTSSTSPSHTLANLWQESSGTTCGSIGSRSRNPPRENSDAARPVWSMAPFPVLDDFDPQDLHLITHAPSAVYDPCWIEHFPSSSTPSRKMQQISGLFQFRPLPCPIYSAFSGTNCIDRDMVPRSIMKSASWPVCCALACPLAGHLSSKLFAHQFEPSPFQLLKLMVHSQISQCF